jgi:hypothetical protein
MTDVSMTAERRVTRAVAGRVRVLGALILGLFLLIL